MNVKTVCNMIQQPDSGTAHIALGFDNDIVARFDITNSFQVEAYGRFRVATFRALDVDSYEITLDCTTVQPITEN